MLTARRWSASTPRSRTRRWPGCRSCTASARRCGRASCSTSTSTPSASAAMTRTSASAPRTSRRPSTSCGCWSAPATTGPRHFDAHPYRNADETACGSSRAAACAPTPRWPRRRAHFDSLPEVQEALAAASVARAGAGVAATAAPTTRPTRSRRAAGDLDALAQRGYGNEHLDQLVIDVLLGVR